MDSSNSSSNSMTSSTVSNESALRSLMKCVSLVISLFSTPICSLTISMTFCSISSIAITLAGPETFPGPTAQGWKNYTGRAAICNAPRSHDHPAVHADDLARDVGPVRRGQESHHGGDLLGL